MFLATFTASLAACGPGFIASGDVDAPSGTPAPVTTGGGTTGTSNAACGVDAYSNYAQTFFQNNCVACHSNETSYAGVMSDLSNIQSYISSGAMPQGATLAAADKARILAWIGCGAPENPNASSPGGSSSSTGGSSATTGGAGTAGGTGAVTTTGGSTASPQCTTDTYGNFVQGLFAQSCDSCHTNYGTFAGIQSDAAGIQSQVSQNLMPPSTSTPLSDTDKQRLLTWFSCNMPQ